MSSASSKLLIVNYHYVRDPKQYVRPGIHPLAPDAFARQVEKLSRSFHMATPEEVEDHVLHGRPLPRDSAFLTFDDGLTDHAETARNILDPLGIKAAFFVCSRPLTDNRALMVHKTHWLRASLEPARFRKLFHAALPETWRARALTDADRQAARKVYVYDTPEDGELKFLINFLIPEEVIDAASSRMLGMTGASEADFCARTYMDAAALRALEAAGHRVGAHSHDHRPVSRLGPDEARDIGANLDTLEAILGHRPTWLSFPLGRGSALPDDPAAFCRRHGFALGFTLTRMWAQPGNFPHAIDRINTNEVDEMMAGADA